MIARNSKATVCDLAGTAMGAHILTAKMPHYRDNLSTIRAGFDRVKPVVKYQVAMLHDASFSLLRHFAHNIKKRF